MGQRYYVTSARELMRVNGTTKAPIVNNFGETISGSTTIRAFKMVDQFKAKSMKLIDVDASVFFHTFTAYEWLVLRLETLCALVLCTSALLMVILPANQVNAGKSQKLKLQQHIQFTYINCAFFNVDTDRFAPNLLLSLSECN